MTPGAGGQTFSALDQPAGSSEVSLLFPDSSRPPPTPLEGEWLADLRLDQLISLVTVGREPYRLADLFHQRVQGPELVRYRQAVCRDLERPEVAGPWREFSRALAGTGACLARVDQLRHPLERGLWFLEAVMEYVRGVERLGESLGRAESLSRGMEAARRVVRDYVESPEFSAIADQSRELAARLAGIRYAVRVVGNRVAVMRFAGEPDLSEEVTRVFARFQQGPAESRQFTFSRAGSLDSVELRILDRVARLFPTQFAGLQEFWRRSLQFRNPVLAELDREAQFYLAYLDFLEPLRSSGLPVCYPELAGPGDATEAQSAYDLVLAEKLRELGQEVVGNDFSLAGEERFLVVSGPNQGGKTTFAVTFGQVHHLTALGLPVAGRRARVAPCDAILTHFGRTEELADGRGRLESDLAALAAILAQATDRSIVILNETFGSASLQDARAVGRLALERLIATGSRGVFVTFIDELALLGPATVSMVSTVVPEDPAERTFKVVRRPPDGLAYALAIARKYGLTHDQLTGRLRR